MVTQESRLAMFFLQPSQYTVLGYIQMSHDMRFPTMCATSKASDQVVHTRSLIRAFASRLNIL